MPDNVLVRFLDFLGSPEGAGAVLFAIASGLLAIAVDRIKAAMDDRKRRSDNALTRGLAVRVKLQMIEQTIKRSLTQVEIETALRGDTSPHHIGKIEVIDRTKHSSSIEDMEAFITYGRFDAASGLAEISNSYSFLIDAVLEYDTAYARILEEGCLSEWEDAKSDKKKMSNLVSRNHSVSLLEGIQTRLIFWLERCDRLINEHKGDIVKSIFVIAPHLKNLPELQID